MLKIVFAAALVFFFAACDDNMGKTDTHLAQVKTLIEPLNEKDIKLNTLATSSVYFEWDYVAQSEGGTSVYQLAFDKADGNFSNPVYVTLSDNNGLYNYASVSHKQMNKIATMMGIRPSETGTFKWTVFSTKGTKFVKASQEHAITITRLGGFEEEQIPVDLYVAGEAAEGGNDLSKAPKMKSIATGEFEVYTKLQAGKTFYFSDKAAVSAKEFSISDNSIKQGGTSTVTQDGVYKITLDLTTGAYTTKRINKVYIFLCWAQLEIELPYKGYGIWGVNDYPINGLSGNDNSDDRYKFRMDSSSGLTEWRAPNNDNKPNGKPEYYYMVEKTNVAQWTDGQVWKSPSNDGWSGKKYDITFSLNPQEPYTHNLVIK